MLLQLVPLKLEARCHKPVVHIPLLVVQVHSLYSFKASEVAFLACLVELLTHSLSNLHPLESLEQLLTQTSGKEAVSNPCSCMS